MLMLSEKAMMELKYAKVTEKQMQFILQSDQVKEINDFVERNSCTGVKASYDEEAFYKYMRSNFSIVPSIYISFVQDLFNKIGNQEVLFVSLGKKAKNNLYLFGKHNLPKLHDVSEVKTDKGIRTITNIKDKLYVHYYSTDYEHHYFVQLDQHEINNDNTINELENIDLEDDRYVIYYPPITKGFALHYGQGKETFENIKELLDKYQTAI